MANSNASDFFGGGVPNLGEFSIPLASTIGGMSDVNIDTGSLVNGQTLVYVDGYWVNQQYDYTDLLNQPTIYSTLSTLTDVDVTPLASGDILRWNTTKWEAVSLVELLTLTQLQDVLLTGPISTSQVLKYTGASWENILLTHADIDFTGYTTNVSATNIQDLANVPAPVANGYFQWDGTPTNVTFVTSIPHADIDFTAFDLSSFSNTLTLAELDGVSDALAPSANDVLTYSGGQWTSLPVPASGDSSRITDGDAGLSECYIDTDEIADTIVIHAGPTTGDIILQPNGTGTVQIAGTGDAIIESADNIMIESTANDVFIQGYKYPKSGIAAGHVLTALNPTDIVFAAPTSTVNELQDLSDVNDPLAPSSGDIFRHDGTNWKAHTLVINDVALFNVGTPDNTTYPDVLAFNGTNWVDTKLTYSNIDMAGFVPTLTLDQLTTVVDTATATGAGLAGSGVLYYRTSGTPAWDAKKLSYTDISMAGMDLSAFANTLTLNELDGVAGVAETQKHVLYRDAIQWTSKQLSISDLSDFPLISAVGYNGQYSSLINAPFNPGTTKTVNLNELEDVLDAIAPASGHVLTHNGTVWTSALPATPITSLDGLSNVEITAVADNQFLVYDTTNPTPSRWKNTTINVALKSAAEVVGTITLSPTDMVIGTPAVNQVIKWDTGTSKWINAQLSYTNLSGTPTLTLDQLDNVIVPTPSNGDLLKFNGTNWVNYTPVTPHRIDDSFDNATGAFVDTNIDESNILISAGDGAIPTGGNIIITPNTGTNVDAAVIIEGNGGTDVYISSDDTLNIESTAAVKVQGITYPAVDGTAGYVLTTNGAGVASFQTPSLPSIYLKNFKEGLTTSYTSTSTITIAAGNARDTTNTQTISNPSTFTKGLVAGGWVSGTGNGGLPAALTLTASRFYYVFMLRKSDGSVEFAFDTSTTAATVLADAAVLVWAGGTPLYRRIGIVWTTATSTIARFTHVGNTITLSSPKQFLLYGGGGIISGGGTSSVTLPAGTFTDTLLPIPAGIFVTGAIGIVVQTSNTHCAFNSSEPSQMPITLNQDNSLHYFYSTGFNTFTHTITCSSDLKAQAPTSLVLRFTFTIHSMTDNF